MLDSFAQTMSVGGHEVSLGFFDTSGCAEYDQLRPFTYPETDVILLCFAIDSPDSMESIMTKVSQPVVRISLTLQWYNEITHHCHRVPIILIGLKSELRHEPPAYSEKYCNAPSLLGFNQGQDLGRQISAFAYMECSAKTDQGVQDVIERAVLLAYMHPQKARGVMGCRIT